MPRTSDILAHARENARTEGARMELQAAIERVHHTEIARAQARIANHGRAWRVCKRIVFWTLLLAASAVLSGIPLIAYLIYRHLKKAWAAP